MKFKLLALSSLLLLGGCSNVPATLKDSIAINAAVSTEMYNRITDSDPTNDPSTVQLHQYLEQNHKAWAELDLYFHGGD